MTHKWGSPDFASLLVLRCILHAQCNRASCTIGSASRWAARRSPRLLSSAAGKRVPASSRTAILPPPPGLVGSNDSSGPLRSLGPPGRALAESRLARASGFSPVPVALLAVLGVLWVEHVYILFPSSPPFRFHLIVIVSSHSNAGAPVIQTVFVRSPVSCTIGSACGRLGAARGCFRAPPESACPLLRGRRSRFCHNPPHWTSRWSQPQGP